MSPAKKKTSATKAGSATKKTTAKKSTVKKTSAKKTAAKKQAVKKTAASTSKPSPKKKTTKKSPQKTSSTAKSRGNGSVNAEQRWQMIAEAAYLKAEQRGFAAGNELADWTAAEQEIDALLNK